jgi:hypothetical protein
MIIRELLVEVAFVLSCYPVESMSGWVSEITSGE